MAKRSGGLTKWFEQDWVDIGAPKKGGGFAKCGRSKLEKDRKRKYPKCVPAAKAARMTDKQIASAVRRKRAKKQGVGGKPTNVKTFAKDGGIMMKAKGGKMKTKGMAMKKRGPGMNKGGSVKKKGPGMNKGGTVKKKGPGMNKGGTIKKVGPGMNKGGTVKKVGPGMNKGGSIKKRGVRKPSNRKIGLYG